MSAHAAGSLSILFLDSSVASWSVPFSASWGGRALPTRGWGINEMMPEERLQRAYIPRHTSENDGRITQTSK